ncbi:MAG: hypothetical protein NHG36_04320, partial [Chromatiaceae bacterium]|nr:hypothetical protein [Candidatus Thioaporhodococcus sediminis]
MTFGEGAGKIRPSVGVVPGAGAIPCKGPIFKEFDVEFSTKHRAAEQQRSACVVVGVYEQRRLT